MTERSLTVFFGFSIESHPHSSHLVQSTTLWDEFTGLHKLKGNGRIAFIDNL